MMPAVSLFNSTNDSDPDLVDAIEHVGNGVADVSEALDDLAVQFKVSDDERRMARDDHASTRREPVSRATVGAGRPPRSAPKPAGKPAATSRTKSATKRATESSTAHPATAASAMIPFDDEEPSSDDVLSSF